MKTLKSGSHVLEFAAEKRARKDRSDLRKKAALQRRSQVRTAVNIAAAEGAFVALAKHTQEHRDGIGVMGHSRVHLDDDAVAALQALAQAAPVRIHQMAILRRPNRDETR